MTFTSRKTIKSALLGFEDVSFTLNKMTEGRRIELRVALADSTAKLTDSVIEAKQLETSDGDPNGRRAFELLDTVQVISDDQIPSVYLKWGLHSIDGLVIDDIPATPESLIAAGPRELFNEIVSAIKVESGITVQQQGESVPPTISAAQVGGEKSSTSADLVESKVIT
jgi:hypothetical protein